MENNVQTNEQSLEAPVITPEALLEHWQGHRRLTRRVIEAFPEDQLFSYSIGGIRPFSALAMELADIAAPGVRGVATGEWQALGEIAHHLKEGAPKTKNDLLRLWDEITDEINKFWPQISPQRFQEVEAAFGQYEGPIYSTVLYFIDNEIHHRGQGYVYLRSLGIEPPPFWERA
ncbi:DinB family protein [Rubrolithibacter danxiaensis]|uniref:DinB family protein n=1 Tax=Rubrolithibacter danxiaensis TaxID=3390805 RepID=UPI003BF7F2CD